MRRALAADFAAIPGVRVTMTLDHRLPGEPGPWEIVRVGPGEERLTLERLAGRADYTVLVAPESDHLHRDRALWVHRAGGRSLGSTAETIARVSDKARLGEELRQWGLLSPMTRRLGHTEALPSDFPYPAVLKPNDGAGAVRTFRVDGPGPFPDGAGEMVNVILQPFVHGHPMSVMALKGCDGATQVLGICRQRIEDAGGKLTYRGGSLEGPAPGAIVEAVEVIGRQLPGLLGCFGIDYVQGPEGTAPTILEVNPRPTTSYVAFARCFGLGVVAGAWLSSIRGEVTTSLPPARPSLGDFRADGTVIS